MGVAGVAGVGAMRKKNKKAISEYRVAGVYVRYYPLPRCPAGPRGFAALGSLRPERRKRHNITILLPFFPGFLV